MRPPSKCTTLIITTSLLLSLLLLLQEKKPGYRVTLQNVEVLLPASTGAHTSTTRLHLNFFGGLYTDNLPALSITAVPGVAREGREACVRLVSLGDDLSPCWIECVCGWVPVPVGARPRSVGRDQGGRVGGVAPPAPCPAPLTTSVHALPN